MTREIGENSLPEGWIYTLLDSVTKRGSGHTPSKEYPEYWNGGIKWVSLSDSSVLDKGYIFKTDKEISDAGIKNSSAVVHPEETVVVSRDAGVGKSAVLAEPMAVSQHFIAWVCDNKEKMNSWFLYYWLQSMKPELERQAIGSTIKTIGLPYFKKLKLAIPPYKEQQKIAKILSVWDKAISVTEQLVVKSQQRKEELLRILLKPTESFRKYKLSDLSRIDCNSIGSKVDDDFEFDYISLSDVNNGCISDDLVRHRLKNAPSRARRIVRKGDVLLSTVRPNLQGFAKVEEKHDGVIASTGFSVLTPHKNMCGDYIYHYVFSGHIKNQINSLVVGTNYPSINSSEIANLVIYCPEYQEQVKISRVLNASSEIIRIYQQKLAALKQEKQALMQQLLTGKRRVAL